MRLLVRRSKPPNIHEALREALELEAIQNAESKSIGPRHSVRSAGSTEQRSKEYQKISNDVRNLKDTVDKLSKSVQQLLTKANVTSQPSQNTSSVSANSGSQHNKIICHYCHKSGHVKSKCFALKKYHSYNATKSSM